MHAKEDEQVGHLDDRWLELWVRGHDRHDVRGVALI